MDRIRAAIRRAADRIEEVGWCRYVLVDGEGRMCVSGALQDVTRSSSVAGSARWYLRRVLRMNVVVWNDRPGRTRGQVLRMLRDVASGKRKPREER